MLSNKLKPKHKYDLLRLGSKNDGGYIIEKKSFLSTEILISFGIFDNWEFEKDFINKSKKVMLYSFDQSTNLNFLILRFIKNFFSLPSIGLIKNQFKNFFNIFDYLLFIRNKRVKHSLKIIAISKNDKDRITDITSIINDNKIKNKKLFFKIDIEGSEYRLLDELISIQARIVGLIIEFHDIDINLDKVISFVDNFNLRIAHIHANNYSYFDKFKNPTTLEITFTNNIIKESYEVIKLPNPLDSPNNPNKDEITLRFEK